MTTGTFDPLTPVRLHGEEYWRYSAELERALRLPKVRNIAVTGSYGAGKSSFIQSFVEDHAEYNFCFVSLATFAENEVAKDASRAVDGRSLEDDGPTVDGSHSVSDGSIDPLERIEASIVQQLLYSVRDSSIPQTRLKRINHVRAGTAALYSVFLAVAASAALTLFGLPKSLAHLKSEFPFYHVLDAVPWLCAAGLMLGFVTILYGVLSSVLGFRLHAVAVKGVSLARPSVMSVLHKQLDEIVYLFERNRIDIVMIEDLDRFSDSSPFSRLREINFIVNSSPSITRPIHFVYMVRDDLFAARDRVKFFDCVIPVVSVINTDNSRQKMLDIMGAREWLPDVCPSSNVIESVSYHVDDMRLLVNMLNEYDLMRSILGRNASLNKDKMFAAVVSRCLFPREYAQLLRGHGVIAHVISSYVEWGKERRAELQSAVSELELKISMQPHEIAATEKELRTLLWLAASERDSEYILKSISPPDGSVMNFNEFVRQGLGEAVKPGDTLTLDFGPIGVKRIEYRELLGRGQGSLDSRIIAAREVASGSARRLSDLRKKLSDSNFTALSQALKDPTFVAYVAKKSSELKLGPVGFFITKGLLGEDYFDYSGYFYPGSISRSDKELMLRVKAGELLPVDSRIDDPAEFLKRMNAAELREGRGIIIPIVSYILGGDSKASDSVMDWKDAVFSESHLHIGRVAELVRGLLAQDHTSRIIDYLLIRHPAVAISIIEPDAECGVSPWRENVIARILSADVSLNDLIGADSVDSFSEIVSSITDGSQFVASVANSDHVKGWLDDNNVWFMHIDQVLDEGVMKALVGMNAPYVNGHNIRSFGLFFDPPLGSDVIGIAWIRAQVDSPLRGWLQRNYGIALEAILEQDGELIEDVADVEWILSQIDDDLALELRAVEKLSFRAESTGKFSTGLWARMLIKQRLVASWENLEKAIGSAKDDELQEIVVSILNSENSLKLLSDDSAALDKMEISRIVAIVEKMVELCGEMEGKLGRFLARSAVALKLPDDFAPQFSEGTMKMMMEEMSGQWCEWLWAAIGKNVDPLMSSYLASCADDSRSMEGGADVPAETLIGAAGLLPQAAEIEQLLFVFIARVSDWDQETSNSACSFIGLCEISHAGAAARLLSAFKPIPMLEEAGVESSCELLARVVGKMNWAVVKELLSVASHSALLELSAAKGEVTIPENRGTIALAASLNSSGFTRKPKKRRGGLILTATTKY
ncbi:hypothetical protein ACODUL_18065 [Stenotrophomonas maltophilia]